MAINRSRKTDFIDEYTSSHRMGHTPDAGQPIGTLLSDDEALSIPAERASAADPHLHNAFMQCPRCCNCSFGCSYFGYGHFDHYGNFVGPLE